MIATPTYAAPVAPASAEVAEVLGERDANSGEQLAVERHAAANGVHDVISGRRHRVGQRFLERRDVITRPAVLLGRLRLGQDGAVRHEAERARFGRDPRRRQTPPEDITVDVEAEVLPHAIERRLRVDGGTVAGASDVVDRRPRCEVESPRRTARSRVGEVGR